MSGFTHPRLALVLALIAGASFAIFAPPQSNPDAAHYYSVALKVSQGDFAASLNLLYSPLLSWLMAMPMAFGGLVAPSAFRLVNFLAYALLLLGTIRIARQLSLPPLITTLTIFLTGLHCSFFVVGLVTSDLLAATCYIWFASTLLSQKNNSWVYASGFIALGYYAKAPQLPIALAVLTATWIGKLLPFKSYLRIGSTSLLLCTPWIIILSQAYGRPLISGQQLIASGELTLDYSPVEPLAPKSHPQTSKILPTSALQSIGLSLPIFQGRIAGIPSSLRALAHQTGDLFFNPDVFIAYILIGSLYLARSLGGAGGASLKILALAVLGQFGFYIIIWGPYYRYYLPLVPLLHIFFLLGARATYHVLLHNSKNCSAPFRRAGKLLLQISFCLALLGMTKHTMWTISDAWNVMDKSLLNEFTQAARRHLTSGVVIGPSVEILAHLEDKTAFALYPPLIASNLRLEYWSSLKPKHLTDEATLRSELQKKKVRYVLWPTSSLEHFPNLNSFPRDDLKTTRGVEFSVFYLGVCAAERLASHSATIRR